MIYILVFIGGLVLGFFIACLGCAAGLRNGEIRWKDDKKPDNANHCICCGAVIPEGRQICPCCESKAGGHKE